VKAGAQRLILSECYGSTSCSNGDETTICKLGHLLERHGLGPALLEEVNAHLAENGLKIGRGSIVDATIIAAPSSTKNATKTRTA
jgi:transposase, IS5 family